MAIDTHPVNHMSDHHPEIKAEESMMRYLMDEQDIQWEPQTSDN
jgi:hypothetical protein